MRIFIKSKKILFKLSLLWFIKESLIVRFVLRLADGHLKKNEFHCA
jgi:hypothetical protein